MRHSGDVTNKPVSMTTGNVMKRDSSSSPSRHGSHGNRNSIEMMTLRGSSQDATGKPSVSTPERNKHGNSNQGYSSHGDIAQTMAQLALSSRGNSGKWRDVEKGGVTVTGEGAHLNPGPGRPYSPSEASSHSVTPPLPPLSPSNTPPMTPPESPQGLPPHLRGNPHQLHHHNDQVIVIL